ncbi:transposable element Tcb2 transposase [Trichonephila clavipes]|nr:transposable element Tcb2 transposase [Trichonephila clavipes]
MRKIAHVVSRKKNRQVSLSPRDPLTGYSPTEDVKAAHSQNHTAALSTGIKANHPRLRDGCFEESFNEHSNKQSSGGKQIAISIKRKMELLNAVDEKQKMELESWFEFGIAHSIVSRLWRQFETTGTAIRGFSSGRPRGTTPTDDRYIVLQARRNRRQTAGEIARHTTKATGRPISRFTVARRLHGGGLFARHPLRCVPLTPAHRRKRSVWCREHRNWRDSEWGRVHFTDERRFSLSSDSHRILN